VDDRSVSQALEGEFSEDGLAALAGEDNMQMALAKKLSERISEADMQRNWGKVQSNPKKKKAAQASQKLDSLSPEQQAQVNAATAAQLVLDTIDEHDPEFRAIMAKLLATDAAFAAQADEDDGWEDVVDEKELDEETGEEFAPDNCRVCGKNLGVGIPAFHVGICEDCDEKEEEVPLQIVELGNGSRVAFDAEPEQAAKVAEQFRGQVLTTEPEPVILPMSADEDEYEGDGWEDEDFDMPELTPEILMKMFANMEANGL
jgi:hypothetical protein